MQPGRPRGVLALPFLAVSLWPVTYSVASLSSFVRENDNVSASDYEIIYTRYSVWHIVNPQ